MLLTRAHAIAIASLLACAPDTAQGPDRATTPLAEPPPLTDTNPDPRVVEVSIVAAPTEVVYLPGTRTAAWGYKDGALPGSAATIPGPILRARRGDDIVVHFRNELPEPTTVHWHGIRLDARMDGSTSVQTPVAPGGTFEYRFRAVDAGTFWYHPHVRADEQIERGLQAPIVISADDGVDVSADRVLVLDDVKVSADGALAREPDALDLMAGRQGNVLLVNGRRGGSARIDVATGARERWRVVNAANGRYFELRLAGHRFVVLGVDGGLLPRAEPPAETLLVAPGERYEVLVAFDAPDGTRATLETIHHDRGLDLPDPGPRPLLDVVYRGRAPRAFAPLPASLGAYDPLPVGPATPVRRFVLADRQARDGPAFSINGESWPFNTPVEVKRGAIEIWEIESGPEMDHPFHLHGMFFQPLGPGGAPDPARGMKDTVNVPRASRVRFAVRYEPAGRWMFHCHILEHAERGMMGDLVIAP